MVCRGMIENARSIADCHRRATGRPTVDPVDSSPPFVPGVPPAASCACAGPAKQAGCDFFSPVICRQPRTPQAVPPRLRQRSLPWGDGRPGEDAPAGRRNRRPKAALRAPDSLKVQGAGRAKGGNSRRMNDPVALPARSLAGTCSAHVRFRRQGRRCLAPLHRALRGARRGIVPRPAAANPGDRRTAPCHLPPCSQPGCADPAPRLTSVGGAAAPSAVAGANALEPRLSRGYIPVAPRVARLDRWPVACSGQGRLMVTQGRRGDTT